MKTYVDVGIVYHELSHRQVIVEFRELFPFAQDGAGFGASLTLDDPRLAMLVEAFERRGIPKWNFSTKPRPKVEYTWEMRRAYDPSDFDATRHLELRHEVLLSQEQQRDEVGRLKLGPRQLRPGLKMGCVLWNATVVGSSVREKILEAGLVGVEFREVLREQEVAPDYFELTSSILLPPMPRERLISRPGHPEDYEYVAGIRDGEFRTKEIHYPASAVEKLEPFDFALTYERFTNRERWPIVSQKFRQFCIAEKIKVSWVPVRLDP